MHVSKNILCENNSLLWIILQYRQVHVKPVCRIVLGSMIMQFATGHKNNSGSVSLTKYCVKKRKQTELTLLILKEIMGHHSNQEYDLKKNRIKERMFIKILLGILLIKRHHRSPNLLRATYHSSCAATPRQKHAVLQFVSHGTMPWPPPTHNWLPDNLSS